MRMLKYCVDRNIVIEIFDNFLHLDPEKSKALVDMQFDKIFVSLDAATKETCKELQHADFDTIISNVKALDDYKRKMKSYFPQLAFHFIITKDNIHEAVDYLDMIHNLGVDVSFVQYTRMLHYFPEIKDQYVEVPQELKDKIMKKSQELGIPVSWNMNTATCKNNMSRCSVWWQPFIFADGTVVPCCSLNEQNDRQWQRDTSLGNVLKTPFREIWKGERYKKMLDKMSKDECAEQCTRCILFNIKEEGK